jgi:hypothetical protein
MPGIGFRGSISMVAWKSPPSAADTNVVKNAVADRNTSSLTANLNQALFINIYQPPSFLKLPHG